MKRSFYLLFSIAAVSIFSISSISLAGSHEKDKPKPATETKITKQAAEQVVRFAYPGCTVESSEMVKGKDHPNWAVSAVRPGAATATQIQVDGVTGKIIP
jgi:hypothetical protein